MPFTTSIVAAIAVSLAVSLAVAKVVFPIFEYWEEVQAQVAMQVTVSKYTVSITNNHICMSICLAICLVRSTFNFNQNWLRLDFQENVINQLHLDLAVEKLETQQLNAAVEMWKKQAAKVEQLKKEVEMWKLRCGVEILRRRLSNAGFDQDVIDSIATY